MIPVEPPLKVKGQRVDYGPPTGTSEEDCGHLITIKGEIYGGVFDGVTTTTSYWQLSQAELDYLIVNEGLIEVGLMSSYQPPISLNVVNKEGE